MPDILLKNELGEDVEYKNVDTVTLRKAEGGTAAYTYGFPKPTENWRIIQNYRDASVSSNFGAALRELYPVSSCQISDGYLVSSSLTGFGLWIQSTYDAIKLDERNFTNMYPVGSGAFLLQSSSLYFYETKTRELILVDNQCGSFGNPITLESKYFICGAIRWYIFDTATKEALCVLDGYTRTGSLQPTSCDIGECWLFSFNSYISADIAFRGIYRLDKTTLAFEQIFDQGYRWMSIYRSSSALNSSGVGAVTGGGCIMDMGDGTVLISSSTEANSSGGFLRYNKETKTITRITTVGYYWMQYINGYHAYTIGARDCTTHIVKDYGVCLVPSSGHSLTKGGMWWYDFVTKELTQISTFGRYYYWYENDDVVIGNYSTYGCAVYDKTTRRWHVPAASGVYYCAAVSEDGIILGGDTASMGVRYYDFETEQLTLINASGPWYYACRVPEGFLLSSGTSSKRGVWLFKTSDKSFTQVWDKGYAWTMKRWNDTVVLGSYQSTFDYNGILLFKDGILTCIQDTNALTMRCMEVVDDGVIVSRETNSHCYFVNGTTGEISLLSMENGYFGNYWSGWYGPGDYNKPTYEFNRKFGDYRVISNYSSEGGCIFNDVTHQLTKIYTWPSDLSEPSEEFSYRLSLSRPYFFELENSRVLIIGTSNYPVMFNYETGEAYKFISAPFSLGEQIAHPLSPYIVQIPTDGGFLLFSKKFDYSKQEGSISNSFSEGVLYIDTLRYKVTKVYSSGYYDTYEETPGGFYIYLEGIEFSQKLYWDAANKIMTQIITET